VPRPQLLRRLKEEREASTVALMAPGGYGKTRLLAEWADNDRRPFVWVTLGLGADDPDQLLATLEAGLSAALGGGQRSVGVPARPTPARASRTRRRGVGAGVSQVLERGQEIERTGLEIVLVLDELDALRSEPALSAVAAVARGLPDCVTLVLSARGEIRAGLARLRAEDRVLELGLHDLAMTAYEAGRLLGGLGVELDEEALEGLLERTEGWPAGLHLAGLVLREGAAGGARAQPSGTERVIADYVREEVLAPLEPAKLCMLRQASILEQLSGELCDAVLQTSGSGKDLHELAREGAMLSALNPAGSWYRAHTLVREVLRAELALREPEEVGPLHSRASEWFAARGLRRRALDHAAAARDASRTGDLLLDDTSGLLAPNRREHERWLNAFGARELSGSPELSLAAALSELSRGKAVVAWQLSRAVAPGVAGDSDSALLGGFYTVEAAAGQTGIEPLRASAERACELLDAGSLYALALLLRGVGAHLSGDRDAAGIDLEDAAAEAAASAPLLEALALSQLALMNLDDAGGCAAESSTRALEALRSARLTREPTAALVLAVSAFVKSRCGISDEAKGELIAATRLLGSLDGYMPWYEVEVRVVMARASVRLADADSARSLLADASRRARRSRPVPGLLRWIDEAWGEIDEVGAAALTGPRSLTMAELRVLRFLPTHLSFREIGERLHVSGNTVKSQAHAVYAKLDASSRSEAVAHASALGLIDVTVV
jgi:LuxR family maltose regulon positive regulatory protein